MDKEMTLMAINRHHSLINMLGISIREIREN